MTKKQNHQPAKRRVRGENKRSDAKRDSMRASRRLYGRGKAK